ncbi:hypothetical protein EV363DRAFT_1581592 [Boletus edulis]|nr:hypothetical protein EV363DRAFT_1581592 [Boletus edulis]
MSDPQFDDGPIATTYSIPSTEEPWGGIHPVTIFQIHQAESSETNPLIMEGQDFASVTLVAHVTRVETSSSSSSYILEDGTGRINAFKDFTSLTHQHGESAEAEEEEIIQSKAFQDTFVEVLGTLKRDSKWKSIKIVSINRVHDYHQVMYHILNVIQNNMPSQQWIQSDDLDPDETFGPSEDMKNLSMDDGQGNPNDVNIQCPSITCLIPVPHPILPSIFSPQKHQPYAALKPLEKAIMKYMHHHRNHHVLIPELAQAIQESCGCTESQFNLAFQGLLSEAYVTSPLDDGYVVVTPRH